MQEEEKYLKSKSTTASLLETSVLLSEAKKFEEEEITRLEMSLLQAKEKHRNTVMKQAAVDASLSIEKKAAEVCRHDLNLH